MLDEDSSIKTEILKVLDNINFPCYLTIDGNGFLEKTGQDKNQIIFCFASINTGIQLINGKSVLPIGKETKKELKEMINSMSNEEFLNRWYQQHDLISDYRGSGFRPRRIINLVITLDPIYLSVTKITQ